MKFGLIFLALLLPVCLQLPVNGQATSRPQAGITGGAVAGIVIAARKTSGDGITQVNVNPKGEFDLGVLPAGKYQLTVGAQQNPAAKAYYESRSNLKYSISVEGTAKGKVGGVVQYRETDAARKASPTPPLIIEADGKSRIKGTAKEQLEEKPRN